jgi:hypothetical protein
LKKFASNIGDLIVYIGLRTIENVKYGEVVLLLEYDRKKDFIVALGQNNTILKMKSIYFKSATQKVAHHE